MEKRTKSNLWSIALWVNSKQSAYKIVLSCRFGYIQVIYSLLCSFKCPLLLHKWKILNNHRKSPKYLQLSYLNIKCSKMLNFGQNRPKSFLSIENCSEHMGTKNCIILTYLSDMRRKMRSSPFCNGRDPP